MVKKGGTVNREPVEGAIPSPSAVAEGHRRAGAGRRARCAVLTVSDSRTEATDRGGAAVVQRLEGAGHEVVARDWVADEAGAIGQRLDAWLAASEIRVVITTGGTGIARRDRTIEVVEARLEKALDGFGELFRALSYRQVGAAAMLSRASGGLAGNTLLFALPGSPAAVELAMDELLIPEMGHLLKLVEG